MHFYLKSVPNANKTKFGLINDLFLNFARANFPMLSSKQIIGAVLDYGDNVNSHGSALLLTVILLIISSFMKRLGGHL